MCGCCLPVHCCRFCAWQGEGLETVGEVEEYFARQCSDADRRLGEPAACRHFLNWFDDASREEMRQQLLAEVERALAERCDDVMPAIPRGVGDPFAGAVLVA